MDRGGYGRRRVWRAGHEPAQVYAPPRPAARRRSSTAASAAARRSRMAESRAQDQTVVTGSASPAPATLGARATAGCRQPYVPSPENRERYAGREVAAVQAVADQPVSTFSVDVDTGSYSNVRRLLNEGQMPPEGAVRTEELINYFRYDYPLPQDRSRPFSVNTDMTTTPWNPETRLLRVGLRGYDLPRSQRPAANLVFLVDVSGSMNSPDKLPLVQCSLALLADRLSPRDRVSIVVYAGAAGVVLAADLGPRTRSSRASKDLQAGGSTAGAQGIQLAYDVARRNMIDGGINRVILATDGDFNVGVTNNEALIEPGRAAARRRHHADHPRLRHGQLQRSDDGADRRSRERQLRLYRQPARGAEGARRRAQLDALHDRP